MSGAHGLCRAPWQNATEPLPELFLAIELDLGRRGEQQAAWIRSFVPVTRSALHIEQRDECIFDTRSEAVVGVRREIAGELVLFEQRGIAASAEQAARCLATAAAERLDAAFDWQDHDLCNERGRLELLRKHFPDWDLPQLDESWWRARLLGLCSGSQSFAQLRARSLAPFLERELASWRSSLERLTPRRLLAPSGREHSIDYAATDGPVLAIKLQEMFGCEQTPTVMDGRVAIVLHLLAPNGRPQQITRDLRSFWKNAYPQLRKELRARYPKHPWPEDPYTAIPTARSTRRSRG